jgi:hypothetical protein
MEDPRVPAAADAASGSTEKEEKRGVCHFLRTLFKLVSDASTDHIIKWLDSGDSFVILAPLAFLKLAKLQFRA